MRHQCKALLPHIQRAYRMQDSGGINPTIICHQYMIQAFLTPRVTQYAKAIWPEITYSGLRMQDSGGINPTVIYHQYTIQAFLTPRVTQYAKAIWPEITYT